jgi:hypothetical protein
MGQWPLPSREALVDVPHPLGTRDYAALVRASDIGLFLYDSHQYYARCAGILVEMLMAAVPVIVPAGCWLAEQIAPPIYAHLDRLAVTLPEVARLRPGQFAWQVDGRQFAGTGRLADDVLCGDQQATASTELPVPADATDLLLTFHWREPTTVGNYLRCAATCFGHDGRRRNVSVDIVGHRRDGQPVPILIHLQDRPARIRIALNNAYDATPLVLGNVQLLFLSAADLPGGQCAAGAVGRIAATTEQIPALLREMVKHYDHYRRSAAHFAVEWGQAHDPRQCVAILAGQSATGEGQDGRPRAA